MLFPFFWHLFHCIRSSNVFRCQIWARVFVKENISVATLNTCLHFFTGDDKNLFQ